MVGRSSLPPYPRGPAVPALPVLMGRRPVRAEPCPRTAQAIYAAITAAPSVTSVVVAPQRPATPAGRRGRELSPPARPLKLLLTVVVERQTARPFPAFSVAGGPVPGKPRP